MKIMISNGSKEPIYEQIYYQIKKLILSGDLQEGDSLPSMRQLAKDLQVSIITTKRAYEELEKSGFIYSIVGKGSFVSEQNKEMMRERKIAVIEEHLMIAVQNGKEIGFSLKELKEMLTLLFTEDE
ncbi:GntR family transcriptional regulator [Peribacillus sp. NPDC097295]|uniref:GntR family transcriptional regulator n=1 Tax=Peribacillus sp. NPDC097295 TaxID=3364402 RepID=UPI0038219AED